MQMEGDSHDPSEAIAERVVRVVTPCHAVLHAFSTGSTCPGTDVHRCTGCGLSCGAGLAGFRAGMHALGCLLTCVALYWVL